MRRPLAIVPFGATRSDALTLLSRRAPGRLGLLVGLLVGARLILARAHRQHRAGFAASKRAGFARPATKTVAKMLSPLPPRVARLLWEPLCLAALNTPVATASAQVFANVLRAAFAGAGDASDFLLPATDLSALFPDAAARFVERAAAACAPAPTRRSSGRPQRSHLAVGGNAAMAQAVIVAVGPHQLRQAFAAEALAQHPPLSAAIGALEMLAYEPIVTVWLGYAARGRDARPDRAPRRCAGQWVLDRPDVLSSASPADRPPLAQLVAVVISASGPHMALPHAELARAVDAQLRRLRRRCRRACGRRSIAEKRATYACTPPRARPAARLPRALYLAGDYVDTEYPATLEAAVRSGNAAAEAVRADRG